MNVRHFCWTIFSVIISYSQVGIDMELATQSLVGSKPQMSLSSFLCGVKLESVGLISFLDGP